jgi:hypothetical protein
MKSDITAKKNASVFIQAGHDLITPMKKGVSRRSFNHAIVAGIRRVIAFGLGSQGASHQKKDGKEDVIYAMDKAPPCRFNGIVARGG